MLYVNKNKYYIKLDNKMKYTSKKYDLTIIEINEDDEINCNYFNYKIIDNDDLKSLYLIHYPFNKNVSVSYGVIKYEKYNNYRFIHNCSTFDGSSGSPIINLECKEEEIIGIHIGRKNKYNLGIFINYPINDFIEQYKLIQYNKKYNLDIKYDTTELNLKWRQTGNLEYLPNLKELTKLDLARNEISDISFLKNVKFEKLKILNLSMNNISNYNILEQVNFKELKELYLFSRNIRSIRYIIFRKCKI
jgi:hypothetical protein